MVCPKLLQVLEETSVAEVIDVSTEKHQLWVNVIGHTVVGGYGVANNGWHHKRGGTVMYALPTAFYQGTKSGNGKIQSSKSIQQKNNKNVSLYSIFKPTRLRKLNLILR